MFLLFTEGPEIIISNAPFGEKREKSET